MSKQTRIQFTGDGADYRGHNPYDVGVVHADNPITDHTLCGITLDNDDKTAGTWKIVTKPINCEQCIALIRHCKSIRLLAVKG